MIHVIKYSFNKIDFNLLINYINITDFAIESITTGVYVFCTDVKIMNNID